MHTYIAAQRASHWSISLAEQIIHVIWRIGLLLIAIISVLVDELWGLRVFLMPFTACAIFNTTRHDTFAERQFNDAAQASREHNQPPMSVEIGSWTWHLK